MSGPRVLNFGSLNMDHVYRVEHIARPGETLSASSYRVFAGGKGANQSAALGLAGAAVHHAGRVGSDGRWLLDKLQALGVDVSRVAVGQEPTGHAVIQVDARGENAIFLYPGANHAIREDQIDACLSSFDEGDILLLQNEISHIPQILMKADARGMRIVFNPAPYAASVAEYPLDLVGVLIANQTEAAGLAGLDPDQHPDGERPADSLLSTLAHRFPRTDLVLTLGVDGARYRTGNAALTVEAVPVKAVDTTGAGDTFIGYFVAGLAAGCQAEATLRQAAAAAALACTQPGAMDSIPGRDQVDAFLSRGAPQLRGSAPDPPILPEATSGAAG